MNSKPTLFFMMTIMLSFLLYQQWQADFYPKAVANEENTVTNTNITNNNPDKASLTDNLLDMVTGKVITIENDVMRLSIDTIGGKIIKSEFFNYKKELNKNDPLTLLQKTKEHLFIAKSGLKDITEKAHYKVESDSYNLSNNADQLEVPLVYEKNGVTYKKIYTMTRGSYLIGIDQEVTNKTPSSTVVKPYAVFNKEIPQQQTGFFSSFGMRSYEGSAYSSDEKTYKKYSYPEIEKSELDIQTKTGWIAVMQRYFVTAWIPEQTKKNELYTRFNNSANRQMAIIGYEEEPVAVNAGETVKIPTKLWIGPTLTDQLSSIPGVKNLELTIDYGWTSIISKPLHILLKFVQSIVSNWGIAIIIVTCIVKAVLYPLTHAQYSSMARMRMLQPKIQAIRERYGDDKQKISQETMALYKKEKVNPLGGCLPVIVQMPIFIGLFYMFMETVEFRHAHFFGWIQDLSAQDPYYILPLLMGASMLLLQKMSPSAMGGDPMQQKIMMYMPLIFIFFFLWFPAGLVLYWIVSNTITIIQQQIIYRNLEKKGLHTRDNKKA